jgi:hypothetical protein
MLFTKSRRDLHTGGAISYRNFFVSFSYSLQYVKTDVVAALAALAQDNRPDAFRLLVETGPNGMPAGAVATALDLASNTLTPARAL